MMNTFKRLLMSSLDVSTILVANLQTRQCSSRSVIALRNCSPGFQRKFYQEHVPVFAFSACVRHVRQFGTDPQHSLPPEVRSLYSMVNSDSDSRDPAKSPAVPFCYGTVGNIKRLYGLGMTNEDIAKCVTIHPKFISSTYIKAHVEFLEGVGLTAAQICNIMQRVPRFFTTAPTVIEDNANYMLDVGVSKKNLKFVLILSPSLFYRVKGRPRKVGNLLHEIIQEHHPNIDHNSMLAHMIRNDIKLFNRTKKEIERNLQFLLQMGLKGPKLIKVIRYCPSALRIGTDFLKQRWDYLQQKLEIDDEMTIDVIAKLPRILTISEDKISERFEFLYGRAQFKPQDVLRDIKVFERSSALLEKRFDILTELNYQGDFMPMLVTTADLFDKRTKKLRAQSQQNLKARNESFAASE